MKIQIIGLLISLLPVSSNSHAFAVTAILPAAPAACATGVGCILVGTVVVGGSIAYVWENGGKRVVTDALGNILKMLPDPDNPGERWEPGKEVSVMHPSKCGAIARKYNKRLVRVVTKSYPGGGQYYVCIFSK